LQNLSTFWQTVITIVVLSYIFYSWWTGDGWNEDWWKKAEKDAKEVDRRRKNKENLERDLRAKIILVTRGDHVKDYNVIRELDWVEAKECESPRFIEDKLKLEAAKRGANAIVKYHWKVEKNSILAGHGRRGNPFFETETTYVGEGLAVLLEKREMRQVPIQPVTKKDTYDAAGWVAIDGNNIFGSIYQKCNDADESFRILNKFLIRLQSSPYKPHVFWDGNFITFARALRISKDGENLPELLLSRLSISFDCLTVSESGKRADELIVS